MKEREQSARRKREEIERKREDQERKRVENECDRNKGGGRERAGRQGKACTAERVKISNFLIAEYNILKKVEQLLRRRATAGEEARQRAEAAATLRRIILREASCQVGSLRINHTCN